MLFELDSNGLGLCALRRRRIHSYYFVESSEALARNIRTRAGGMSQGYHRMVPEDRYLMCATAR
jgi:hypothetical protein